MKCCVHFIVDVTSLVTNQIIPSNKCEVIVPTVPTYCFIIGYMTTKTAKSLWWPSTAIGEIVPMGSDKSDLTVIEFVNELLN